MFVGRGTAIEVTHRSKWRLFGLKHLVPLREEVQPSRGSRGARGSTRQGTVARWPPVALPDIEGADDADAAMPLCWPLARSPVER